MAVQEKVRLERAAFPEQVGVCSKAIQAYMEDVEASGIESHSFMVLRHGKVAFETWREPYSPDMPHTLYSVSKSVTSLAIGFAVAEGILSLDDKVIEFFPEHRPKEPDPWLEKMTVWHLLTMTSGKDVSLLSSKAGGQWVKQFFAAATTFEPGTDWKYISENTYMLCAILHKVIGTPIRDFLVTRLFEPLGIDRYPFWEVDENGVEAGGWGLYLTTEELAKIVLCCQQMGKFNGKQVIPEDWVREATKSQAYNPEHGGASDAGHGYGFCFWMNGEDRGYRFDGMFSQFGIVMPEYDAVLVLTDSEINEHKVLACVWRHFPAAFIDDCETEPADACRGMTYRPLADLPAKPRSPLEKSIDGKTIRFPKKMISNLVGFPVSMLSMAVTYMSADRAGNMDRMVFRFTEDECILSWEEGKEKNSIVCGMDGKQRRSPMHLGGIDLTAASTAAWTDEKTLELLVRPMEVIAARSMRFRFKGNKVSMWPSSTPNMKHAFAFLATGVGQFYSNKLLVKIIQTLLPYAYLLLEPKHSGKMQK